MAVLRKLGLPFNFIALIALLYSSPTARLRVNGSLSAPISISRGTRQGCPLSPLLFIIAMDPLVRRLQENHLFRGLQFLDGPLLISLYADDILLFVRHPQDNLPSLIDEISRFGTMSGLKINWGKSVLFPGMKAAVADEIECLKSGQRQHQIPWSPPTQRKRTGHTIELQPCNGTINFTGGPVDTATFIYGRLYSPY